MFNFFWKGNSESKHYHFCKWELFTLPKKYGGWGLWNIFNFKKALAINSLWCVLMCDVIWHKVIIDKYLPHTTVKNWFRSSTFHLNTDSRFWKGLLKSINLITHWLRWSSGSGHLIALGRDMILGMGDKSFIYLNILSELNRPNITSLLQVRRLVDHQSSSLWISNTDLGLLGVLADEWNQFRRVLIDSVAYFQDKEDEIFWIGGDNSGILTVKNTYQAFLSTQGLTKVIGWRQALWKWDLQLKIKCIISLVAENKILTLENLKIKGWEGPSRCHLCLQDIENTNHLFIHCSFAKSMWERLEMIQSFKNCWNRNTLNECFKNWVEVKFVLTVIVAHIYWFIWLERNSTIFKENKPSIHSMIYKILGLHKRQLKSKKSAPLHSIMISSKR